jgi:hypothetical protein
VSIIFGSARSFNTAGVCVLPVVPRVLNGASNAPARSLNLLLSSRQRIAAGWLVGTTTTSISSAEVLRSAKSNLWYSRYLIAHALARRNDVNESGKCGALRFTRFITIYVILPSNWHEERQFWVEDNEMREQMAAELTRDYGSEQTRTHLIEANSRNVRGLYEGGDPLSRRFFID